MSALWEGYATIEDRRQNVGADTRIILSKDGTRTNVTSTGDLSVTVVHAPSQATVTVGAITAIDTGQYGGFITGPHAGAIGVLTATWNVTDTGGSVHVFTEKQHVVSDYLYTLEQARQFGPAKMASSKVSAEKLTRARYLATRYFEDYANVSFVQRYEEFTRSGNGSNWLDIPVNLIQSVSTVSIGTTAFTAGQLANVTAYDYGRLYYSGGWDSGYQNVTVGVVHGYAEVPPEIRHASLRLTQSLLGAGAATDRTIVLTDDQGTHRLAVPNMTDRPTGIPEVDHVLNRFREPEVW
jgi:hypothetical protein